MRRPLPAARSRVYRLFSRLPYERMQATRRRGVVDHLIHACEVAVGGGPVLISGGIARGCVMDGRSLALRHVQAYGLVRGVLEPGVQEALRRHVTAGAVVCDVGANIGFFSLLSARLAGPEGHVHAFEPSPPEAAACRRNADLNDLAQVTVHEAAVGSRTGRGELMTVGERSWSYLAARDRHPDAVGAIDVDVLTLDSIDWGGRQPDVVKIDVEGSEIDVLRGMTRLLDEARPVIVCELHETNADVADFLENRGYVVENLDGALPVRSAGATHIVATDPAATARKRHGSAPGGRGEHPAKSR